MKNPICVYLGQELADYHFGETHPFGPKRHEAFRQAFYQKQLDQSCKVCEPVLVDESLLANFHTPEYIQLVKEKSRSGEGYLDYGDTPAMPGIFETTRFVVGSVLDAADKIMSGECRHAFIPIAGLHHAQRNCAAGFCVFNDCAILIEYLRQKYQLTRIAYVDIDAHHGDGVYYGFEDDPNIFIADIHEGAQYLYPGTGTDNEIGVRDARGTKLNINLSPGSDDASFHQHWPEVLKFLADSKAQFIVLQCGADSVADDPITHMAYTSSIHYQATRDLIDLANKTCDGRLIACGGGGYNLQNIADAWTAVVQAMIDAK